MTGYATTRRTFLAGATAASLGGSAAARGSREYFAFSYFDTTDNGRSGLRLAISEDGLRFSALGGNKGGFLVPEVGESKILRDPCVFADPLHGGYGMVWTTSWDGQTIGVARSPDLVHWGPQTAVPVMAAFKGTRNCWAPEAIYDPARRHFVFLWSSTVDGAFPETANPAKPRGNHRIYCTTTRDFRSFTPTRLLFNPGFDVIDATFGRFHGKLYLFFKDETDIPTPRKFIQFCEAGSPMGPFGKSSLPISPQMSEGPTAYQRGDEFVVLYDKFREHRFGGSSSRDLKSWRDISDEIVLPQGASHGTVLPISLATYRALSKQL